MGTGRRVGLIGRKPGDYVSYLPVSTQRQPVCDRNFEHFDPDPYLREASAGIRRPLVEGRWPEVGLSQRERGSTSRQFAKSPTGRRRRDRICDEHSECGSETGTQRLSGLACRTLLHRSSEGVFRVTEIHRPLARPGLSRVNRACPRPVRTSRPLMPRVSPPPGNGFSG